VLVGGRLDDVAGRGHDLRADQLIGCEAPGPDHPADASAEGESADADGCRVAGADRKSVGGESRSDITPDCAASDVHDGVFAVECQALDLDVGEGTEFDPHSWFPGLRPGAVSAGDDGDGEGFALCAPNEV